MRFHFHVRADELIRDMEGQELTDEAAATSEARYSALELLGPGFRGFPNRADWRMEVADAHGNPVVGFSLSEVTLH